MLDRYDLIPTEDGGYTFFTDLHNCYLVFFADFSPLFNQNSDIISEIFMIVLYKKTNLSKQPDIKVKNTVKHIICDFFDKNPLAGLIYNCDNIDGKECARDRIFKKWLSELDNTVLELDAEFSLSEYVDETGNIKRDYTGIVFMKDHVHRNHILNKYQEVTNELKLMKS